MGINLRVVDNPKDFFEQELNRFEDGRISEVRELDKMIFIIGTGIFVLSINYITNSTAIFYLPKFLLFSWLFLFLCIVTQAIGYRLSVHYHEQAIQELAAWKKNGYLPPIPYGAGVKKWEKWVRYLNEAALFGLIIGGILLTIFVSANFYMRNNKNQTRLPNGALIRQIGDFRIYLIEQGKARWVTQEEFKSKRFKLDEVVNLGADEFLWYR